MAFDGSGTYSLSYSFAAEAGSPPIAISKLDTEFSGIATGLSLAILRNGNGKPTADIDWNAKKITNLAAATADTDALNRVTADARYAQLGGAVFTGAVSGTSASFSTTLACTGNFAVNTDKFTVAAATGNTVVAGTLGVTGATTLTGAAALSSTLAVTGNVTVNTNKVVITASSGNTTIAGTLGVTGTISGPVSATTLAASSTVSGAGFSTYLASPPAIGTTAPAGGRFTFAHTAPVAVTFNATTMAVDCALSNVFTTTFTANVTVAPTISNPKDGQTINWFITQDGTGGRTMTWPSSFKWPGGTAGVLSTAINAVDMLVATYRSSTGFWYCSLLKGFA